MRFLTSRITLVVFFLLTAGGLIGLISHASWYRWDMKMLAPIAYEIGVENEWYSESAQPLSMITTVAVSEFERKLVRQGFSLRTEEAGGLSNGFHRDSEGLKWYLFDVDEGAEVYVKSFLIASGFCSQTVGVLIGKEDDPTVRYLNPGGTCV